jgi:uncharacterized protein
MSVRAPAIGPSNMAQLHSCRHGDRHRQSDAQMSVPGIEPLSEAELDELSARLAGVNRKGALRLEGLDGFFCALIASPRGVSPSEYLPIILGGEMPNDGGFANLDEANVTVSLIIRHWNSIITDLDNESIHVPLVVDVDPGEVPGRDWARGFMRGVRLAGEGWYELFDDEKEGDLFVIPLVAGEMDPDWPKEPLTKEEDNDIITSLTVGAARSYQYFAEARRANAEALYEDAVDEDDLDDDEFYPETYVRPEPKVGRNEPCPCGSGRKYKKCCGVSE